MAEGHVTYQQRKSGALDRALTGRAGCGDLMGERLWFCKATNKEVADLGGAISHPIADTGLSREARR